MKKKRTTIIAEAGVNHNGSIQTAKELIKVAAHAGADIVKFQTFKAESLLTKKAEKAHYQKAITSVEETQFEMIKNLELNEAVHFDLMKYAEKEKIQFLSTPFDTESIQLLDKLGIPIYKIPSGEINNLPYLKDISKRGKPIIISTGMSTMDEIRSAIDILIQSSLSKDDITVLHCNTEYPTPMKDVNLNAMVNMGNELDVKVGYSDHTLGIEVAIAAVALGAEVIEKHFTLDRSFSGPDHSASLEPNELKSMVTSIRNIEFALGDGIKRPSESEKKNISIVRKSIIAKKDIKKGELFSEDNLSTKRPGTGISPMLWDDLIGRIAQKSFQKDDLIK